MTAPRRIFVTGIGTGVGKTICSAVVVEALAADYWKPIQAGDLHDSDSMVVRRLVSDDRVIHPEAYRLTAPCSPHASAAAEGVRIEMAAMRAPQTMRPLVIEGAGGLMVPLDAQLLMIDLIAALDAAVLLVSRHYLGSINHTLLSVEALRRRSLPVLGIVFNGAPELASEEVILRHSGLRAVGRLEPESAFDRNVVRRYAELWRAPLLEAIE